MCVLQRVRALSQRQERDSGLLDPIQPPEADFGVVSNTDKYDIPGN